MVACRLFCRSFSGILQGLYLGNEQEPLAIICIKYTRQNGPNLKCKLMVACRLFTEVLAVFCKVYFGNEQEPLAIYLEMHKYMHNPTKWT